MTTRLFEITPIPKPRQTKSDRWKKRDCVLRYRAFADAVRLRGVQVPECGAHIIFHLPMPSSWSKEKRLKMVGQPHQEKPDADNLVKALLDALYKDDAHIWDYRISKRWSESGGIEVGTNKLFFE